MNTYSLNIAFIFILFQIYNVNLLRASQQITSQDLSNHIQLNTTAVESLHQSSNNCTPFINSVDIKSMISKVVKESTAFPARRYFLFFFGKIDLFMLDNSTSYSKLKDFGTEVTQLFPDVINITFYCQTIDLTNYTRTQVIGVYNGAIIENKKMETLTYEYLQYLLNTFNLKPLFYDHVRRGKTHCIYNALSGCLANKTMSSIKSKRYSQFIQKCCGDEGLYSIGDSLHKPLHRQRKLREMPTKLNQMKMHLIDNNTNTKTNTLKGKENDHRISRLLWSLLIVIIVSLAIFFLVKYSIDWATSSKTEINKQKDQRFREIAEILTAKVSSPEN